MASNLYKQNIFIALEAIKSQKLRAALTMLIIAIGIMALVGILTAIDALKSSINSQFSSMGANSFTIERLPESSIQRNGKAIKASPIIKYTEAESFKSQYQFQAVVSVSTRASWNEAIKYKLKKTKPNISIYGGDNKYLSVKGRDIGEGRNFTPSEVNSGAKVCILGSEIADDLFDNQNPIGEFIKIKNIKYEVIGVMKEKGSSMGFSGDRDIFITLNAARQYFSRPNMDFNIHVLTSTPQLLDAAIYEATGIMRNVRGDVLGNPESFRIRRSDSLSQRLIENIQIVTLVATIIALITLLGAAIGLMNIMLVSVTERTKEIGTRKALGANSSNILLQFLTEAIVICQMGGFFGVFAGIAIGNIVSLLMGSSFIIPWMWIGVAFVLCFAVGVFAGYYPAKQAAKLDPIEALRHE